VTSDHKTVSFISSVSLPSVQYMCHTVRDIVSNCSYTIIIFVIISVSAQHSSFWAETALWRRSAGGRHEQLVLYQYLSILRFREDAR